MCGIVVSLRASSQELDADYSDIIKANSLRGPDNERTINKTIEQKPGATLELSLTSSVLHLRGDHAVGQPHVSSRGDILCWNGEIFEGIDIRSDENDGSKLFALLTSADETDLIEVMGRIEGPYAFVFYQNSSNSLYYSRDPLGRRSLLIRVPSPSSSSLILASTSLGHSSHDLADFEEIDPRYIYHVKLREVDLMVPFSNYVECLERRYTEEHISSANHHLNPSVPSASSPLSSDEFSQHVEEFTSRLAQSVLLRVGNIPPRDEPQTARLGILFSGGIDCAVLAYFAHKYIPLSEPIDLLNVAFENPRKVNAAARSETNNSNKGSTKNGINTFPNEQLFQSTSQTKLVDIYMVPDRATGLEQLEELQRICPGRKWNFVKVNVDYAESTAARPTVEKLMFPSRTVMDMSLALALYFASRGIGKLHDASAMEDSGMYRSPARVLLSGLGSDELLGGYSRHRMAFRRDEWKGLIDELQMDLDRLPSRNLGRDDRVISANAREARYPYLSLPLVSYLASLPVHVKLNPNKTEGVGDKMLLRETALRLGLTTAATRKKRAMQFGSRSAKMNGGADERKGNLSIS